MKTIIIILLMAGMFAFYSCGDSTKTKTTNEVEEVDEAENNADTEQTEAKEVATETDTKVSDADNCDEFLNNYEKWVLKYIDIMEKYMKNPMDTDITKEYMELAQEATQWYTDWLKMAVCTTNETYQKRFEEIEKKVDMKMKELGLD